jgi:hypothetical protein
MTPFLIRDFTGSGILRKAALIEDIRPARFRGLRVNDQVEQKLGIIPFTYI